MKRYLIWIACLFLGAVAVYFAWNQAYLPKGKASAVTSNFYTEKADIVRAGSQERFVVKGVEVDSFLPGYYDTDYAVDKATYKTWFEQIAAMNANTIRANNIYDPDFYNALYEFNTTRNANGQTPLYLIQVVPVTDYAQNSADNAWSNAFYNALLRNAKRCVDVVHGREFCRTPKRQGMACTRVTCRPGCSRLKSAAAGNRTRSRTRTTTASSRARMREIRAHERGRESV